MQNKEHIIVNANQAVAQVAYQCNDIFPIYPITPSSEMSELVEEWSALSQKNIFDNVPETFEMQSEAGVAGAMHGMLQTGALASTFTSSQGLLLMLPNMYKIAAELTPNVIHVATRSVATQALSIFGDHSDVMAIRSTGYAMLASASVQEAMDFALIAQAASLESRIPFVHFFDGFRTSHEIAKVEKINQETIKAMMDSKHIVTHKQRALDPNHPIIRGTTQGPDVYFQGREVANSYYQQCPNLVQKQMDVFAKLTGRSYQLFEYIGHEAAEQVIIAMASATETLEQTIHQLNAKGEKVGLVKVRLYRPFGLDFFLNCLPASCKAIAVLDRTKEPGSLGEPLFLDVQSAVSQSTKFGSKPKVIGGRYGLGSKEFTPSMVKAIVDELKMETPKHSFTVGITDDVTQTSLEIVPFDLPNTFKEVLIYETKGKDTQASFHSLVQELVERGNQYVQGYFEIDYKKSESRHVTNLRMAKEPIKAPYLIQKANAVVIDNKHFLENDNVLDRIESHGVLMVQTNESETQFWTSLESKVRQTILSKALQVYLVTEQVLENAAIERGLSLTSLHNSMLDLIGLLEGNPIDLDSKKLDISVEVMNQNQPNQLNGESKRSLTEQLLAGQGNALPVSSFPVDGTYPTRTSHLGKRLIIESLPEWNADLCTQCGACSLACPSGALRAKAYSPEYLEGAPEHWNAVPAILFGEDVDLMQYTIQVNADQCTSCNNCVDACPVKALVMKNDSGRVEVAKENWSYFEILPEIDRSLLDTGKLNQQQLQQPLFTYPNGEDGCGEAPYLKLASQLFGDRMLIANATGASSIFGGALPTTPWSKNKEGRGPAWSNSLFEDNAEFGLGFRLSLDQQKDHAKNLLQELSFYFDETLVTALLNAPQTNDREIAQLRDRVATLKRLLKDMPFSKAQQLREVADALVSKSVWIIGGDGWAYDIGFGGLDHVLSSGRNVNILVLDNEVYANTGGQMSKATPYGASAKFASKGKKKQKKDLGILAMQYDDVYVASVAIGADPEHTLKAFLEAEAHDGPSLIIAYCHSITHGIDSKYPSKYHKAAVASGQWLLYRNNPKRILEGMPALQLDSESPKIPVAHYLAMEERFQNVFENSRDSFGGVWIKDVQQAVNKRFAKYQAMAGIRDLVRSTVYEPV